jgi:tRNA (cytidine32/uridine32-2'-O)-methyltransferase
MSENLRIVLVGTQHPGNIGSAARAMKTMGLDRLELVAPLRFPHADADALAAGARDLLERARVHATLEEALAGCRWVVATTARSRTVPMPELSAREAARRLREESRLGPVALLFGRERTGLENDELRHCHASVTLPANPDYSSLNLASAVQVLAYELRLADLDAAGSPPGREADPDPDTEPAPLDELEGFFAHLGGYLVDIDFHKGHSPAIIEQRLRRLFLRARPTSRELRILRGVLSDSQRLLRLGGRS